MFEQLEGNIIITAQTLFISHKENTKEFNV